MAPSRGGIVIFSGGSAANSLVDVFESIRRSRECSLSYIIPISDNGGSSSELIRVFGGPGIGDVRSRLVRLIPQQPHSKEREAIGALLSSRLSSSDLHVARNGWSDIVDGTSSLWRGIPSAKKELIRSFFNLVNLEILKRSRPPSSTFDFRSASIGNLFLTGARLFSGSFESAIYLLSAVCGIPDEVIKVIPSINSNFSHHIAAELEDGTAIVGQNSISHPSTANRPRDHNVPARDGGEMEAPSSNYIGDSANAFFLNTTEGSSDFDSIHEEEDAHPPFTLRTLRASNIAFTKSTDELDDLPSRISRIHYVNSFGQEILPPANPRAIQVLQQASAIIYSIGSLYTSIVPNLVLRGIGDAMRKSQAQVKVLILNGCLDREVGPYDPDKPFTAADFINAIVKAGEQGRGVVWSPRHNEESGLMEEALNVKSLRPGVQRAHSDGHVLKVPGEDSAKVLPPPMLASAMPSRAQSPSASPDRSTSRLASTQASSRSSSKPSSIYKHYVTHLIHLPNAKNTPFVDKEFLAAQYGVKCMKVYGRRDASGAGMLYDPQALRGSIEAILGGRAVDSSIADDREARPKLGERERGRRNTVEG